MPMMDHRHRRAKIIDALATMFEALKAPVEESGFPIQVMTVQKRFAHWAALHKQNALPAILLRYGSGSAPDSDVVGFIDEQLPIAVTAAMVETQEKALTDQASDIHFSIGSLINANPTLGVEGVNPDRTGIMNWQPDLQLGYSKFEVIRFNVLVVHRYHASEDV